jgi:hypothetical protein
MTKTVAAGRGAPSSRGSSLQIGVAMLSAGMTDQESSRGNGFQSGPLHEHFSIDQTPLDPAL